MRDPASLLDEGPGSVDLGRVLHIFRKRLWLIAAVAIAVPSAVAVMTLRQPKVYQARANIVIDPVAPQYLGEQFREVTEIGTALLVADHEALETEFIVMNSHSMQVTVARALCNERIDGQPALARLLPGATCTNDDELEAAAPILQAIISIAPMKDSRVVNLMVTHHDPKLAATVANTLARVYTQHNLERRLSNNAAAGNWLGDEFGNLASQVEASERQLIDFKRKNNVVAVSIEDQQNDLSSERRKLVDELNGVRVRLIALRSQRNEYERLRTGDPLNDVTPGVTDSPVVLKLKELYVDQYAKLLELRGKYLDKHPSVIAQEARVAGIKADLLRESSLATKNVEAQYATAMKQEQELRIALDRVTHDALQLEQRAIDYNRLKRNYERLQKLAEQVGGRERETEVAKHLKTNNVRMLDAAMVPAAPISPNVPRAVSLAILLGIVLGIGLAYILELLDSTVKSQADVEEILGVSFLGMIPSIDTVSRTPEAPPPPGVAELVHGGSRDLHVLAYPKSAVAECCRSIRTNLLFMTPDRPAKTLLVASQGPQEGKSITAINLAIAFAQSGLKVLLVDTDMRRPRLHKAFAIPSGPEGLSTAIVGEADVRTVIRQTGVPGLSLLPCGSTPPNPAELLHADRLKQIVDELAHEYDRVIFDSPPLGAVTDAAILAHLVNGTILVAKAGRTSKDALRRAYRQLIEPGTLNGGAGSQRRPGRARRPRPTDREVYVLGCILNDFDVSRQGGGGGYYYYSQYGGYYTEDDAAPPPTASASRSG